MKLKYIILTIALLLFCSCTKEYNELAADSSDGVRICLTSPAMTMVETRSAGVDEMAVKTLHVLVFDDNGGDPNKFIEISTVDASAEQQGKYSAVLRLTSSEGAKRHVRIIANGGTILEAAKKLNSELLNPLTATWESISEALIVGTIPANPKVEDLPTTPIPMTSEDIYLDEIKPGTTVIGTISAPVVLKSGYAKISLQSERGVPLTITAIALHNAPAKGNSIFATDSKLESVDERVNYHQATSFEFNSTIAYLFPTSAATHKTDLIIKGRFGNEMEDTYYRIAMIKPVEGWDDVTAKPLDFWANYHYKITLTEVGTHGYPTKEQAVDSPYSNIIVDIDISNLGNDVVSNGQYYMSLSDLKYEVRGNLESIKISTLKTDAPSTVVRSVKVISGADVISKVELRGDEIRATTNNIANGSATVRVIVGNLYQDIVITNTDPSVAWPVKVSIDGNVVSDSLCTVGEQVKINAPFREKQKFSKWVTNLTKTYAADFTTPTLTFTMPNNEVSLTVVYSSAPSKMTVRKPGRIVNKGSVFEPALVRETDTTYVRYYAMGEYVYIDTPQVPFEGSEFTAWSGNHGNFSYNLQPKQGGGGTDKLYTYFKMFNTGQVELEATPQYQHGPYWSTEYTKDRSIAALFIDRKNPNPGMITIPAGYAFVRPYTRREKDIIMRALNTLENTFANRPCRTIKISFAIINLGVGFAGAVTDPGMASADDVQGHVPPKSRWLATDFNGIATGLPAISSRFEAAWRDQLNVNPNDAPADNSFIGYCDGCVALDNRFILQDCYLGDSESAKPPFDTDFETLMLHEVGHIVTYHSTGAGNASPANGMTACDVFIADKYDPANKRVVFGNIPKENDETVFYSELVKSYYGNRYIDFTPTDYSHLSPDPLGTAVGSYGSFGPCCRSFPDFELAMLQEMGWKINPKAWKNPPSNKNVQTKR